MTATAPGPAAAGARALAEAAAGTGRLLLLTGPAGAGKTHLARQLEQAARRAGMRVVWTISGSPGAPAFWPFVQLLRALPPAAVNGHPGAQRLLGATRQDGPTDLRTRFALFADIAAVLTDAASATPLLVVIDDLHEADAASLLLVQHLAPLLRAMRVLLVTTVRTDTDPAPADWPDVWPSLVRHGESVRVGPLPTETIAGLVEDATGSADPLLVQRIAERTRGNALFVTELIRLCASGEGGVDALPETVRAVIGARVGERSPLCRRVLSLAAVAGATAPLSLVADVLGEAPGDLAAGVDEGRRYGLVGDSDADRLAFVHEIVRDAIYEALPVAHRMHWHREIADRYAQAGAAADAAYHYRLAGPDCRDAAAHWFVRAGEQSMGMLAYENAAAQFRAALDCGPTEPGWVQLRLGGSLVACGDAAGARIAHLAAAEAARTSGHAELLADAALGLGAGPAGFEITLFDREQITALEDALALCGTTPSAVRATLLARLSVALTFSAAMDRRSALADQAVAIARQCDDDAALAAALASQVDVIAGPEHAERRLKVTSEIVALAERLRDASLELLGRRQRIVARLELGDMVGLDADIREFRVVADALRQPLYQWYVPLWHAGLAHMRGDHREATAHMAEAQRLGTRAGSGNADALIPSLRFIIAVELGEPESVRALMSEYPIDESLGPWVPITLAFAQAKMGDIATARATLDAAADRLTALPRDSEWIPTLTQAAEAVALVAGHPVAQWLYDELLPFADQFVIEGIGAAPRGSVERHLGLLAAALGDRAAARRHFARALERNRAIGARLYVARTLHDAASSLDDAQDLAAARAAYAELGIERPAGADPNRARAENVFHRDGDVWTLTFAGRSVTVRDSKGLRDIASLLAHPGRPFPAVELVSGAQMNPETPAREDQLHDQGDLGELIDEKARRAYRLRLGELEEAAADADTAGDVESSARIAVERDALVAQLSAAYGIGGRPRKAGSQVERARTTVTARIRDSIRRVALAHPELGRHLAVAVRTGTVCSYEPEQPVRWQLTP